MLGGTTIESTAQADSFTKAMREHPKSWGNRGMDPAPLRVGEDLDLEHCVPKNWQQLTKSDTPCPRVELWAENELAGRIVFAGLPEHTRPLLGEYVSALAAGTERGYARRSMIRGFQELQGKPVANWIRAQYEPKEKD